MSAASAVLNAHKNVGNPGVQELIQGTSCPSNITEQIGKTRSTISHILNIKDDRLLVIVGPCSIHDTEAALNCAHRLSHIKKHFDNNLCIIMRCNLEKPRTRVGWKGLIYDPYLDGSSDMETELIKARKLLLDINTLD
ncbi:hypothetical protein [Microbulbifer epialgicus]|uniref:3-deoxy-7-phosphoheptulonate synthase n=1 Tax=Microbulbifer epialgicus TaxID=393907 RepID=A0ABV4P5G9_9GAMM